MAPGAQTSSQVILSQPTFVRVRITLFVQLQALVQRPSVFSGALGSGACGGPAGTLHRMFGPRRAP